MKELRIRSGLQSRKSNCPVSNTFGQPLSALSTIRSLPSVQTVSEEDEVVIRDWLHNFRPIWQRTIRSESCMHFKIKRDLFHQRHVTLSCYLLNLFKKAKNFFLHPLNSKNNSPVLLFQTIIWYWYCFPSSVAIEMDCSLGQQQAKIHNIQQPEEYDRELGTPISTLFPVRWKSPTRARLQYVYSLWLSYSASCCSSFWLFCSYWKLLLWITRHRSLNHLVD